METRKFVAEMGYVRPNVKAERIVVTAWKIGATLREGNTFGTMMLHRGVKAGPVEDFQKLSREPFPILCATSLRSRGAFSE